MMGADLGGNVHAVELAASPCGRCPSWSSGRAPSAHSRTDGTGCGSCVARHPRAGQFHPARHARNLRHAGRYARPSGKGGRLIMTTVYAIAMIAVAAVCTFATRVAPFLLFNGSKPIPPIIDTSALPAARSHRAAGCVLPENVAG